MTLIPSKNENSLSYWCSWHTQNTVAKIDCMEKYPPEEAQRRVQGGDGARLARTMLNEELVFGENGYAHHYPESTLYCEIPEGVTTVGVFGENCEMRLRLPKTPARVLVQSLIGDEVTDGTSRLVWGDTVVLSAEDMKTLFATDDRTAPALLIRIEYQ